MDVAIHRRTRAEQAAANERPPPRSRTRGSRGDAVDSLPLFLLSAAPVMRKAGCGCGSCPACAAESLRISEPGDSLEREAQTTADQVMREAAPVLPAPGSVASVSEPPSGVVPAGGRELDAATRAFMEPRFGFDFSRVRVHDGPAGAQSARELSARAYTAGHHLVFGAGEYAPATHEGRRLIAHELAHVVQQAGAGPAIQRDVKKEETKDPKQAATTSQDLAVVFGDDVGLSTMASVLAKDVPVVIVRTPDDLAKQLKSIKGPLKTLYFFAHMTDDGNLMFHTRSKQDYRPAAEIAEKVKGTVQVENLNFQGCSIAQAPAEMNRIAVSLKATRARGSTCTLVEQTAPPVKVDGKPIIRPEQLLDKRVKAAFDKGLKDARDLFVDKKKNCILNDTVDGYFQAGGRLIAHWANPGSMADETGWDDTKSICYKDLKTVQLDPNQKLPVIDEDDCKLIELAKKKP
jgi:Domain of unknown function (DUF4157)